MGKKRTLPREILTDAESDALLEQCDGSPEGMRDRALLLLLEGTGCRISEVLALEPRDIDYEHEQANVRCGKGGKQRMVAVAPETLVSVRAWLEERGGPREKPIVGMTADEARKRVRELAKRAGIRKRVHPHGFRHRHTIRLVRAGVPITSVSTQLGHSSIATTHTYCQRLGVGAAIEDVQRALDAD